MIRCLSRDSTVFLLIVSSVTSRIFKFETNCVLVSLDLHERKFPILGLIAKWGVRLATGGVLVGVYQFNTNDIGLTELTKKIWKA